MSKKQRASRGVKSRPEAPSLRPGPNWPLLALSIVGVALTAYLSWTAFSGAAVQGCAAGGGCEVVLNSQWAKLFGLPTAFWGLLAYLGLGAVAFIRRPARHWLYAFSLAFFGVCYSLYLTTVSLGILASACPYCLTSLALMTAILALVVWQRPPEMAHRSWPALAGSRGAIAAVAILLIHGSYMAAPSEPIGPEDPVVRALAEHLTEKGVVFYGASWCPHCQEQKRLFGASASRLPYIACSPGGRNAPQAPSCISAGVQVYPTWIIDGRRIVGQVLSLSELANSTAFPQAGSLD